MKHNEQKTMQDMPLEELWPLIEEVFSAGGRFRLFPRGNSMLPLIRPNIDSVLIERPTEISRYDILLYRRQNGQFVLHRLMKIEKDTFTMCGDHQYYLEKGLPRDAVLARVCGIYFGAPSLCQKTCVFPSFSALDRRSGSAFAFLNTTFRFGGFLHGNRIFF